MTIERKYKIAVVTGTRAEYGLLRPILKRLRDLDNVKLELIVTGSHLVKEFGNTQSEIISDGFKSYISVPLPFGDDSKKGMTESTGETIKQFARLFDEHKPDLLVVLGDRFEIFGAVSSAYIMGIKIAHIGGGDVTEGAVDDALRHCITKMSHLHFPGTEEARRRIIQMGENPENVFNVGELGVENCIHTDFIERDELARNLDFTGINENYSIVTFHPVTKGNHTEREQLLELIGAMDSFTDMHFLITMANADAGGREINKIWIEEVKKRKHWKVVSSLGVKRYLSAMKYSKLCIGNSSSGLVEAPALGIPTINIGDRQKGRIRPKCVIDCNTFKNDIINAMNLGLSEGWRKLTEKVENPFGNGTTSVLVTEHIISYLNNNSNNMKSFFDIEY